MAPAVVFNSAFGGDSIYWTPGNGAGQPANQQVTSPITNNPTALNNPEVYLIFWGKSWTNATAQKFANDAKTILQSGYLSGLKDYGSDGLATYGGFTIDNSAPPSTRKVGPPVAATQEIDKILPTMNSWAKPQQYGSPAGSAYWSGVMSSPIYVVVFDNYGGSAGNGPDSYIPPGWPRWLLPNGLAMNHIWIGDSGANEGNFTYFLSHELVERISSGGGGIAMNAQVNAGTDGEWQNAQIADNEPDGGNYTYRLDGSVLVQAYWSLTYKAFVVPDGNTQAFYLNPIWSGKSYTGKNDLYINGDQSRFNDDILISQNNAGGVQVTLNGETASFNQGQISSVTVRPGGGNNIVNVQTLPAKVSVDLEIHQEGDAVIISPSAQSQTTTQYLPPDTYVLGSDGNLWYELTNPSEPDSRQWVDGKVRSFEADPANPGYVYVLGTDGNLWYEEIGWQQAGRSWVDGKVQSFKIDPLNSGYVYVLGTDGNLWHETIGWQQSGRSWVDGNVRSYQPDPVVSGYLYVQGTDGNLWFEPIGWQNLGRSWVDGNVQSFEIDPSSASYLYVLGTDGNLWYEDIGWQNYGRSWVDASVRSYQVDPFNFNYLYVLGTDGNLWYETIGWQQVGRSWVDGNVQSFQADPFNSGELYVLGSDGNLWYEAIGWQNNGRSWVDGNVQAYEVAPLG
jgi:hypothetical protein